MTPTEAHVWMEIWWEKIKPGLKKLIKDAVKEVMFNQPAIRHSSYAQSLDCRGKEYDYDPRTEKFKADRENKA